MTIKEKKDILKSYIILEKRQKQIKEEIEETREAILKSPKLDDMPHGSAVTDLSNYYIKLESLQTRLAELLRQKMDTCHEILTAIERMQDGTEKMILMARYIEGQKWTDIMEEAGYERSRVFEIHLNALKNIELKKGIGD